MSIKGLLDEKRIIICSGSGGVGKTTVSAALALYGAMNGKKSLVCTIDPAKRLADSLGLKELGNRETRIGDEAFAAAGLKPRGELWGMMLDSKRTFDQLIERIAPNAEARDRILANHYYQNITSALAGSEEFAAMEKLYELWGMHQYDLIVLDTPPTKHALDFLEAPGRMTSFLDGRVIQWFVKPYLMAGKMGFAFVHRSATLLFKILEKATGYQTMADIAEFFLAFEGLYEGFKKRAERVSALFTDEKTAFCVVTSPQTPALAEARFLLDRLAADDMPVGSVIFNRVHQHPSDLTEETLDEINERALVRLSSYAPAVDGLIENLKAFISLSEADASAIAEFLSNAPVVATTSSVPFFDHDVHDLAGLMEIADHL